MAKNLILDMFSDTVEKTDTTRVAGCRTMPGQRMPMGRYIRETRTPEEKLKDTINTIIALVLMIIASALVVLLVFLFYENMKS